MKNSLPEPIIIRQYLLGRFDQQDERENALSEQILCNDKLAELVESTEDEIIDEYLDGTLDASDRKDVEGYFLRPPERKEKLRFARVLRAYFKERQNDFVNPVVAHWNTRLLSYWPHAALILLAIVSLMYVSRIHQREVSLEAQLMRERTHPATLVHATAQVQPAVAVLTLVLDRTRGTEIPLPRAEITRSTKRFIVEIVLATKVPGPYGVRLESNETHASIWSAQLLPLVSADGARLLFDVPDEHLISGKYSFVVSSGQPATARIFDFQVTVPND